MTFRLNIVGLLIFLILPCYGQESLMPVAKPVLTLATVSEKGNFTSFSMKQKAVSDSWKVRNPGFLAHPDAGYMAPEQPVGNVIELLEKRTETTRFYIDGDSPGKIYSQGSYGAIHYRKNNAWLIIDSRLNNKGKGIIEAARQPEPVGFDVNVRKSYILTSSGKLFFNDWKLYGSNGKSSILLARANWDDYTAGDDGLFVRNIFPGVDAEMSVMRGRIKTNLIVRKWNFTGFESFFFADSFVSSGKGSFEFVKSPGSKSESGELDYRLGHRLVARIGRAAAYAEKHPENVAYLSYSFESEQLRIHITASELQQFLREGTMVIDPIVMGPQGVYTPGTVMNSFNDATCSFGFNTACSYTWTVPVPPFVTVTNTHLINKIETLAPCTQDKMRFRYGFDDQLCGTELEWIAAGLPQTPGTSGGNLNITPFYNNCIKAGCEERNVKVTMSILRGCMGPAGCESSCVRGIGPYVTTIEGRTLEMISVTATPDLATCAGDTVRLSAVADFGIKPYTYQWTPGNLTGGEVQVTPLKTTTYQVTVKDACNQAVSGKVQVSAPPVQPAMTAAVSVSATEICEGSVVKFSSAVENTAVSVYQWRINGIDVPGATSDQFSSSDLSNNDKITLRITNQELCANPKVVITEPVEVKVYPNKPYEHRVPIQGCDSVEFEGRIFTSDTTLYQQIQSRFGCDSVNRIIEIRLESFDLTIEAMYDPPIYHQDKITLRVSGGQGNFEITAWDPLYLFPDQHAIQQFFQITGQDSVFKVYAKSEAGCIDSASVMLKSGSKPPGNLLPNVFTPDSDGLNDVWTPLKQAEFPVGELFVYNRWGECIFYTSDYTVPWDGKHGGVLVPAGVYAYRLIIAEKLETRGSVTILY